MLGEDHQLFVQRPVKGLVEQARQFNPFVGPRRCAARRSQFARVTTETQFRFGVLRRFAPSRSLVEDLFLYLLDLIVGRIVEIVDVVTIQLRNILIGSSRVGPRDTSAPLRGASSPGVRGDGGGTDRSPSGDDASRRWSIVSANPTVLARLLLFRSSALRHSCRT